MKSEDAAAAFVGALVVVACSAQSLAPVVAGVDDVKTALCILEHYATDTLSGKSWDQTLQEIEQSCKTTEASTTAVIAEHNKATDSETAAKARKLDAGAQ